VGQTSQNLIGERVKEARSKAQPPLTQEELAKKLAKLGVSIDRAGIAKVETGIRGVLDFELVALAKALGVKVNWLLALKE
jgi:HTH-type transcriptional regulator, cell division transcriptional repressor